MMVIAKLAQIIMKNVKNVILIIIKRRIIHVLKLVMKELEKIQLMAFVKFVLILIAKLAQIIMKNVKNVILITIKSLIIHVLKLVMKELEKI